MPGADLPGGLVPRWPADVDGFLEWLLCTDMHGNEHANARRAGVMYLIYNRRIWRAYDKAGQPKGKWYPYGGSDDHTTPIEQAREVADATTGARLEILSGCGHYPFLQELDKTTDLIRKFLRAS